MGVKKGISEEAFIEKIRAKKELEGIPAETIRELIHQVIKKKQVSLADASPHDQRMYLKEIRARLRLLTGRFVKSTKYQERLLDQNNLEKVLDTHSSTHERKDSYEFLKKYIDSLAPHSILDLGCGINPLALAKPHQTYYAYDLNKTHLDLIEKFFKKNKIQGTTAVCDLRYPERYGFPQADLCIILKVLDIIDEKGHAHAHNLMLQLSSPNIIVSFATRKISGRKMNYPHRAWFEKFLKENNYEFTKHESSNEVFYLIRNRKNN